MLFASITCTLITVLSAQTYLLQKLQPDGLSGVLNKFGNGVSISQKYAVVADESDYTEVYPSSGAVYVYRYNSTQNEWHHIQTLYPNNPTRWAFFGNDVSIFENYIIIGAYGAEQAYIFKLNETNNTWYQLSALSTTDLPSDDSSSNFGWSVDITDGYAIVGDFSGRRSFIFIKNVDSETGEEYWIQNQTLFLIENATRGDFFGYSVSISYNYAIVGSLKNNGYSGIRGSAYIFELDETTMEWQQVTSLILSDSGTTQDLHIDVSIDSTSGLAIIGTQINKNYTTIATLTGANYIFQRDSKTGNWSEMQTLNPSNYSDSVSINDKVCIIGSDGAAYVYQLQKNEATHTKAWQQISYLNSLFQESFDDFGYSVSVFDDFAIVGTYGNNSVYIFSGNGSFVEEATSDSPTNFPTNVPSMLASNYTYYNSSTNYSYNFTTTLSSTNDEIKIINQITVELFTTFIFVFCLFVLFFFTIVYGCACTNKYNKVDRPNFSSIFQIFHRIFDLFTDILALYSIYIANENNNIYQKYVYSSFAFLVLPFVVSITITIYHIHFKWNESYNTNMKKKYLTHYRITNYISKYDYFVFLMSIITCDFYCSINLCQSKLFCSQIFNLQLTLSEKQSLIIWKFINQTLSESIPQIVIQLLFLHETTTGNSDHDTNVYYDDGQYMIIVTSLIFSMVSILYQIALFLIELNNILIKHNRNVTKISNFNVKMTLRSSYFRSQHQFIHNKISKSLRNTFLKCNDICDLLNRKDVILTDNVYFIDNCHLKPKQKLYVFFKVNFACFNDNNYKIRDTVTLTLNKLGNNSTKFHQYTLHGIKTLLELKKLQIVMHETQIVSSETIDKEYQNGALEKLSVWRGDIVTNTNKTPIGDVITRAGRVFSNGTKNNDFDQLMKMKLPEKPKANLSRTPSGSNYSDNNNNTNGNKADYGYVGNVQQTGERKSTIMSELQIEGDQQSKQTGIIVETDDTNGNNVFTASGNGDERTIVKKLNAHL